jgi:hypothetical protein
LAKAAELWMALWHHNTAKQQRHGLLELYDGLLGLGSLKQGTLMGGNRLGRSRIEPKRLKEGFKSFSNL